MADTSNNITDNIKKQVTLLTVAAGQALAGFNKSQLSENATELPDSANTNDVEWQENARNDTKSTIQRDKKQRTSKEKIKQEQIERILIAKQHRLNEQTTPSSHHTSTLTSQKPRTNIQNKVPQSSNWRETIATRNDAERLTGTAL